MDARELIEEARDGHPSYTRGRHPDPILLRALSRYQRDLAGRVRERDPNAYDAEEAISLPLADFDAGHTLPDYQAVHGGVVVYDDSESTIRPFELIAPSTRAYPQPLHSGWILEGVLYLSGRARDWTDIARIDLRYTPLVPDLTTLADELVLPDTARRPLVAFLEATMAKRAKPDDGVDRVLTLQEYADAERRYLEDVWTARPGKVGVTPTVW